MEIRTTYHWFGLATAVIAIIVAWYCQLLFTEMKTDIGRKTTFDGEELGTNLERDSAKPPNAKSNQSDQGKYDKKEMKIKKVKKTFFATKDENLEDNGAQLNRSNVKLHRIDPVKVGHSRHIKLDCGERILRTLSVIPPIFEIEDFLSEQECEDIIFMAQTQGLERSRTVVDSDLNLNCSLRQDPSAVFRRLDSNEDGELELSERQSIPQSRSSNRESTATISLQVKARLLEEIMRRRSKTASRNVVTAFSQLQDAFISDEDARNIIMELDLDADKNNVVSYSEFLSLIREEKHQTFKARLKETTKKSSINLNRVSSTAFLDPREHQDFIPLFDKIRQRIRTITNLSTDMIWSSENLQVLQYSVDGHYHCHYDSLDENEFPDLPCCHHLHHLRDENCLPCRYVTFFYYLKEPEEGGETAFIMAGNTTFDPKLANGAERWRCDLSHHCQNAGLVYKPKRGTALMWYNHVIDKYTEWLGPPDPFTSHGGCDVIKGTKWAANSWINAGVDLEKDKTVWKNFWQMEKKFQERLIKTN